ncbi:DUF4832 domain-containing protein [Paludisphaera rhizosphaerae]|uniref:DUF4832 domain-containing protein n=1 Tax=Paludisphaera rhizosphaerae TaxID=2711216 RepID=UPI0013EE1084|nr:DUF4832 domain-containing protein [Paludisphaera rhizosphaerae]
MNRFAAIATILALTLHPAFAEDPPREVVHPVDDGRALVNPDMGWTLHYYSNIITNYGSKLEPSDTLADFPGLSTVYLRVPWAFLEPEEGKFNWSLFDTPARRFGARGIKVAIRVTSTESWMRDATPRWVQAAGAKGVNFAFGKGPAKDGPLWEPDYLDPVFLAKLDAFLAAMAKRYDGNPDVAFIDVGSFGMWGEGHTGFGAQLDDAQTLAAVKVHVDLYRKHFPRTLLAISDDVAGPDKPGAHQPATDYALSKGVTLRDDSILVQPPPRSWYHAEMAQAFWPKLPVVLEHEHYGGSKQRNAWDGGLLLKSVEDYHASYMSIHWWPRIELEENRETIDRINRRMGYRIQLRSASWPRETALGDPFTLETSWANAGVAPCYPTGFPALTLKDEKGGIVSVNVDESFDVRTLEVGPPEAAPVKAVRSEVVVAMPHRDPMGVFTVSTSPGTYDVFISVGRRDGAPVLALPLPNDDGARRYKLGRITLTGRKS